MIARKKKICIQCGKPKIIFSHGRCTTCTKLVSMVLKKGKAKEKGVKPKRKKQYDEIYLWPIYNLFVRFRDTDKDGIGSCFTCGAVKHWKQLECGHGIGRQHKATKYNEYNNHIQCHSYNGFNEGRKDVYKIEVDIRYGKGTWDLIQSASMATSRLGRFEYDILTKDYLIRVVDMAIRKNIDPLSLAPVKFILKNHEGANYTEIKETLGM